MDKSLVKTYLFIALSIVMMLVFVPDIIGRTSAIAMDAFTHIRLAAASSLAANARAAVDDTRGGRVVFVLDDGWESQYSIAYPLISEYGYTACVSVIPAAVGTDGYMTYSQLADLYLDGWEMLNHTYNHITLANVSREEQAKQMRLGREWLEKRGLARGADIVVFPGGAFDDNTLAALKDEDFVGGRSLRSLWSAEVGGSLEDAEVFNLLPDTQLKLAEAAVEKAANNGSAVIFMMHKVEKVTDDDQMQIEPSLLRGVLDCVRQNEDRLSVVTLSRLLEGAGE